MKEKKVTEAEFKEMVKQMNYTGAKQITEKTFEAVNPFNEKREFLLIQKDDGNLLLMSRRNLFVDMNQHKNFQTFEMEYISDDGKHLIFINDYVANGQDMLKFVPDKVKKEVTDVNYDSKMNVTYR